MFLEESLWIKNILFNKLDLASVHTVLDVGSSTLHTRTVDQPFIDENIFRPLRKLQKEIYHMDAIEGDGVDICCDVKELGGIGKKFDLIISANLLEHVVDHKKVVVDLMSLLNPKGYLLLTVPYVLVRHEEPIDTMYRPNNKEVENLCSNMEVLDSRIIQINRLRLKRRLSGLRYVLTRLVRRQDGIITDLLMLGKRFKVSCVAFRK